jgi:hypothetical protein
MDCNGFADAAVPGGALSTRHILLGVKPGPHGAANRAAFFPALGVGFLTANWLIAAIPGGRDFFNQPRKPGLDRVGEQRQLIKFSLMLLLVTLPISVSASLCQFCLQPHAIAYQPYPWTGFRQYTWEDVSAVTATCRYSRGRFTGWRKQFILEMHDGPVLDLMAWPTALSFNRPSPSRP